MAVVMIVVLVHFKKKFGLESTKQRTTLFVNFLSMLGSNIVLLSSFFISSSQSLQTLTNSLRGCNKLYNSLNFINSYDPLFWPIRKTKHLSQFWFNATFFTIYPVQYSTILLSYKSIFVCARFSGSRSLLQAHICMKIYIFNNHIESLHDMQLMRLFYIPGDKFFSSTVANVIWKSKKIQRKLIIFEDYLSYHFWTNCTQYEQTTCQLRRDRHKCLK